MNTVIHLNTKNTSYIMSILPTGYLQNLYYGKRINKMKDYYVLEPKNDVPYGTMVNTSQEYKNIGLDNQCLEYSSLGKGDFREPAVELTFDDGSTTCDFKYKSHNTYTGRNVIEGLPSALPSEDCETTEIILYDDEKQVTLTLYYTSYPECDIITRYVKISNTSSNMLKVRRLMSAQLDLFESNYSFISFDGCWSSEANRNDKILKPGIYVNDSKTGYSSCRHNPFVMLAKAGCNELHGECYASNLIYSGCHSEICEVTYQGKTRLLTGINPSSFCWLLDANDTLYTPEAVLTYSCKGFNGISQNMHKFVREYIIRGFWKDKERPILVNNWEATSFNFNQKKILSLAKDASELGIELFVLDDGWFGKRNDETSSLGDWNVNLKKLPDGIDGLCKKINALGMKFGLWVEPEMISEDSDLYRTHPEWAIGVPGRSNAYSRNQFVLDLTLPEVRKYIIQSMSTVFSSANIEYIKWDMNRNMSDFYGKALPAERQGEFFHRYMLGLYEILNELTTRFPNILFESCAAGGNRFDLGMLCYMPQIWTSDNTDAFTRINIQSGTSYGYPQTAMGAHVSASPCFSTLRNTPIETRFNVAAFGLLGYELDLTKLTTFDKNVIKEQIAFYKKYRKLFQFGEFYRLENPMDINRPIWLVLSHDKKQAIVGMFQGRATEGKGYDILRTFGLEDNIEYSITGRTQYINIKAFGNLINSQLPVEIKADGVVHTIISSKYMLKMSDESYVAGGDLLNAYGIRLIQQYSGTGYNDKIRLLSDYGSRIYIIEAND